MRNYIILNGKNSNEINGLLIQELPPISKPQIRTEIEEIDGRDGDIVTKLGFAAYDKEISVGLYKDFDINEIIAYFNSEGTIVFSNEPDKYYNYQIIDQIDFERLVRYRTATIRMHCQPFKYSTTQGTITKDASATVSDEGSNLVLENTAEAPFNKLEPKGNATQETLSGKNKMPIESEDITSTRDHYFRIALNAGTYTISYDLSDVALGTNTSFAIYMTLAGASAGGTNVDINISREITSTASAHKVVTFTIAGNSDPSQQSNIRIAATNWNNGARAKISNIQIEAGSTATDFEPYVGGIPSPNPDYPQDVNVVTGEQTVKITGKNLAIFNDGTNTYSGVTADINDGTTVLNGTSTAVITQIYSTDYVTLKAGQTYTLSANNSQTMSGACVRFRQTNGNVLSGTALQLTSGNTKATFTPQEDVRGSVQIRLGSGSTFNNFTIQPQLELGSEASQFEPHRGQDYAISLGSTELAKIDTYQDYIWNDNGTWKIHKEVGKVVLNGSESGWGAGSISTAGLYRYNYSFSPIKWGYEMAICDYFTMTDNHSFPDVDTVCFATHPGQGMLVFFTHEPTLADFKTWLSTHNTTVYYALATPTDTEITDSELIEQLEALAEAHSYKGRTHINATATGNNAPHIIAAEVGVDNESTVTNSGNINSKPVIKIYGSGNIGAYLNDIQILQIALGDEGYITIDTNLMEAYKDTLDNLKNRLVTGDYSKFSLKPGANKIHFSGTVTKYEISKYSRWL